MFVRYCQWKHLELNTKVLHLFEAIVRCLTNYSGYFGRFRCVANSGPWWLWRSVWLSQTGYWGCVSPMAFIWFFETLFKYSVIRYIRFAIKCLDKRRLKLKHQEASAVHERNVLAEVDCEYLLSNPNVFDFIHFQMHSKFVTNLKYAFHNDSTLFLVLDLMEGFIVLWYYYDH
jgi:hypothetical protein